MVTYSQLLETPGTNIGGLLRDSNITFPDGKYIKSSNLASQLLDNGVKLSWSNLHGEILSSPSYGTRDNIWTRVQAFSISIQEYNNGDPVVKQCYNPWKEIMGGLPFDQLSNLWSLKFNRVGDGPLESVQYNPREAIERLKGLYKLFIDLKESYQDGFIEEVDTHSCTLFMEMFSEGAFEKWRNHPIRSLLTYNILKGKSKEDRRNLQYTLDLMAAHDLCFSKGPIVRGEIEDLMGYDTSTIPTHWEEGTLDDAVIQERVAELNEMLEEKVLRL